MLAVRTLALIALPLLLACEQRVQIAIVSIAVSTNYPNAVHPHNIPMDRRTWQQLAANEGLVRIEFSSRTDLARAAHQNDVTSFPFVVANCARPEQRHATDFFPIVPSSPGEFLYEAYIPTRLSRLSQASRAGEWTRASLARDGLCISVEGGGSIGRAVVSAPLPTNLLTWMRD